MKSNFSQLGFAIFFAASLAISTPASAQNDAKRALAVKLAQLQVKSDGGAIAEQLTASAVQPLLASWSQRLDETVPPARQKEVRDKLDVELKKFADNTQKSIEAQVAKSGEAAMVPVFMEKLTEDELKTIITYLESPVSAKFLALGPDATNAWAKRVVDATKPAVEGGARNFDAAATRIVGAATGASGSAPKK
ncbi:MAG: DUF2059 domain-containing protein [Proteobacteria bacterium]|nr:DUF2059 domain-containing protein [Pseudomonadota bacterium]